MRIQNTRGERTEGRIKTKFPHKFQKQAEVRGNKDMRSLHYDV